MAKQVMPEAKLESRETDLALTESEWLKISLFEQLKNKPSLDRFPGAIRLRHYRKGEVICRQGEAGFTAFYLITSADELAIRQWLAARSWKGRDARAERAAAVVLERRVKQMSHDDSQELRIAAHAVLSMGRAAHKKAGLLERWTRWFRGTATHEQPTSIVIDGPSVIDRTSMRAPLHEGELFGEMSCLYHTPRSATIVASRDCCVVELLRNILSQLQKDPLYKARLDAIYKERVLQTHLRRLSLFSDLSDEQFTTVRGRLELVSFDPGEIIFDEHEESDSMYVIRRGLVKTLKKASALLCEENIRSWDRLIQAMRDGEQNLAGPAGKIWDLVGGRARTLALRGAKVLRPNHYREILFACNLLIKDRKLGEAKEFQPIVGSVAFRERLISDFPEKKRDWSEQDYRRHNRLLIEMVYPDLIRKYRRRVGPECILSYASQGDYVGEMALITGDTRKATCIAHGHPTEQGGAKEPTKIELVRISGEVFQDILNSAPSVRAKVEKQIAERMRLIEERAQASVWDDTSQVLLSERAEKMGLVQGQKLMLIDLDRCTRCDECVRACADTHDDGHTRLFLDGPRFGKYLVPTTCRSCLDPLCMIGCPVGSIHRGDNNEICIEDWCIGCGLCAKQCPYGAIQMHDIGIIPEHAEGWRVAPAAAVKDPAWMRPRFRDRRWLACATPVAYDNRFRKDLDHFGEQRGDSALCFRYTFDLVPYLLEPGSQLKLEVHSTDPDFALWLNGEEVKAEKQKGKREHLLASRGSVVRSGQNVLAVRVTASPNNTEGLLHVRMDVVNRPKDAELFEGVTEKSVSERAVVCDLCSSLLGQVPSCVNACPHDAAMRVDARFQFPTQ